MLCEPSGVTIISLTNRYLTYAFLRLQSELREDRNGNRDLSLSEAISPEGIL